MLARIISGGQTGADRAALDACLAAGFPCGGFCPAGRLAEDGAIDPAYPLEELPDADYAARTRRNVEVSDGSAIFHESNLHGGTALTRQHCEQLGKPCELIDLRNTDVDTAADRLREWISRHGVSTLNVAGPRASACPAIHEFVYAVISRLTSRRSGSA